MNGERQRVTGEFNRAVSLPYQLRIQDFEMAMRDVYDFFHDVNALLLDKGLSRLDDMLRPAAMSGIVSDMLTASIAKHSRTLVEKKHFNGHPDLIVQGRYPNNGAQAGTDGIEIKSTRKTGGAVDTHGARDQWMCVFVYATDQETEPAAQRRPMRFTEVYLGRVTIADFRSNSRGTPGTRTATLDRAGILKLRQNWIYRPNDSAVFPGGVYVIGTCPGFRFECSADPNLAGRRVRITDSAHDGDEPFTELSFNASCQPVLDEIHAL